MSGIGYQDCFNFNSAAAGCFAAIASVLNVHVYSDAEKLAKIAEEVDALGASWAGNLTADTVAEIKRALHYTHLEG